MRTRSFVLVFALALPGLAGAEEPPAAESDETQVFAPLDLRDPEDQAPPAIEAEAEAPEAGRHEGEEASPTAALDEEEPAPAEDPAPAELAAEEDPGPAVEAQADEEEPAAVGADGEVLAAPAPPAPAEEEPFAVGLKADLLVPTSQVDSTGALSAEFRYRLPYHQRRLALAAEVGWYPLGGEGRSVDPQLGTYGFEWRLDTLPIHLGVEYLPALPLRLPAFLARLRPYGEGGLALAFLWSKATYRNADGGTFIRDNLQTDTALGWYLGAGALYRLGPGDLVGGYRHDGLKTDMDLPVANEASGDVGGSHVQAGYRLVF